MKFDVSLSLLGYFAILLGLGLLHLYFWMIGVGVALVAADELLDLYVEDQLPPLPGNPFARRNDDK